MIVQIYTSQAKDEALDLVNLGVDHVGITVSDRGLPGEISFALGLEIVAALRGTGAKSVALTVDTDLDRISRFVSDLRPDIVHLCGDVSIVGPNEVKRLRSQMPEAGVEWMQAIPVTGPESVELAAAFAEHVDWLILDSVTDAVEGIGAAGVTHDWRLSRQIVSTLGIPVVLAGGLGPDNVAAAVDAVDPAGVDSLTFTNVANPDGTFRKDLGAVEKFVAEAKSR